MALDWQKAFNSVSPEKLISTLRRFGLLSAFMDMIMLIHRDWRFFVRCLGEESGWCEQAYGIVQGCLLSPFLFVIVIICFISDVNLAVEHRFGKIRASVVMTRSILYADDILLINTSVECA